MADRPTLHLKGSHAERDPRRKPVRGRGGPARPQPSADPAGAAPTRPQPARRPSSQRRPDAQPAPERPRATLPPPASQQPGRPAAAAAGTPQPQRVSKLLTERGLASRREADDWIAAGWVSVDGAVAVLGQRATADAVITLDPRATREQARRVTVLLHKPIGYVSGQPEDGHAAAVTLIRAETRWSGDRSRERFHPGQLRGLAPAGRLDIDSTGLLVFTQDGRIAKLLIGDQTRVEKEYLVRVAVRGGGRLPEAQLERLRHGLELDGVALRPARVSWQNEDQLRFVLREGRKRQIRRMCDLVGLDVVALKRVRIGSVVLGALPPGHWRYLDEHERFV